jgi:hypothetical protein
MAAGTRFQAGDHRNAVSHLRAIVASYLSSAPVVPPHRPPVTCKTNWCVAFVQLLSNVGLPACRASERLLSVARMTLLTAHYQSPCRLTRPVLDSLSI